MVVCRMASVFSVWLEAQALIPDPSALTHLGISLWAYLLLFSVIAAVAVAQLFQACAGWSCCQFRPYEGTYLGKLFTPVIPVLASINRLCQTRPAWHCASQVVGRSVKSWALNIYWLNQNWKFKPLHLIKAWFLVVPRPVLAVPSLVVEAGSRTVWRRWEWFVRLAGVTVTLSVDSQWAGKKVKQWGMETGDGCVRSRQYMEVERRCLRNIPALF